MKKHLSLTSLLLLSILMVNAQQDTTRRDTSGRDTSRQFSQQKQDHQHMHGQGKKAKAGNKKGDNATYQQGAATDQTGAKEGNVSGQMTSTGRYAAMGVQMGSLHRKDMKFVMLANSSNAMELQLSQMAVQKATNPAVKDFANMMVEHHTKAGQEMKQLLSTKGAMIPDTAMLSRHRMRMEMLQNLQGAEFDKTYMRIMVDAHEEDVDEYEDETTDARDADVRAFATRMLPTLQTHYTRAKEVRRQLNQ